MSGADPLGFLKRDPSADADLQAALELSRLEGGKAPEREDDVLQQALSASEEQAALLLARRRQEEDKLLQDAIQASLATPAPPEPGFEDDEDLIQKALKASMEAEKEAEKKRQELRRSEDDSDLFQAALRASRVDLGPRGISQAAKIMATGDEALGQAKLVAKSDSHKGSGGKFSRKSLATLPSAASSSASASPAAMRRSSASATLQGTGRAALGSRGSPSK